MAVVSKRTDHDRGSRANTTRVLRPIADRGADYRPGLANRIESVGPVASLPWREAVRSIRDADRRKETRAFGDECWLDRQGPLDLAQITIGFDWSSRRRRAGR
jgi:hypothetical protein